MERTIKSLLCAVTTSSTVFGTEVPSGMERHILFVKTTNQHSGANLVDFGYSTDGGTTHTTLDYFDHSAQHEMNDYSSPEKGVPAYILPPGSKLYAQAASGDCYLYVVYEDVV